MISTKQIRHVTPKIACRSVTKTVISEISEMIYHAVRTVGSPMNCCNNFRSSCVRLINNGFFLLFYQLGKLTTGLIITRPTGLVFVVRYYPRLVNGYIMLNNRGNEMNMDSFHGWSSESRPDPYWLKLNTNDSYNSINLRNRIRHRIAIWSHLHLWHQLWLSQCLHSSSSQLLRLGAFMPYYQLH